MSYEVLEQNLTKFDQTLLDLKMVCPVESPVGNQLQLTRDFLRDRRTLSDEELLKKWDSRFDEFYKAQIVVARLTESIAVLSPSHSSRLRPYLKTIFSGDLTQGVEPSQAKDFFYELWLASSLYSMDSKSSYVNPTSLFPEINSDPQLESPASFHRVSHRSTLTSPKGTSRSGTSLLTELSPSAST
jgi:hypothetical protein